MARRKRKPEWADVAKRGAVVALGSALSGVIVKNLPEQLKEHADVVTVVGGAVLMREGTDELMQDAGLGLMASGARSIAEKNFPDLFAKINGTNQVIGKRRRLSAAEIKSINERLIADSSAAVVPSPMYGTNQVIGYDPYPEHR